MGSNKNKTKAKKVEKNKSGPASEKSAAAGSLHAFPSSAPARFLLYAVLTACPLALGAGIRLWEVFCFDMQEWTALGEMTMATADSYFWLAGAQGFGQAAGQGMAKLLQLLHQLTGMPIGTIAFYLPAFVAPLVTLPVCILCFSFKSPFAAVSTGLFCSSTAAFFFRTRLGTYDTDLVALFFPTVLATGIILITLHLKEHADGRMKDSSGSLIRLVKGHAAFAGIILLGLWGRIYLAWYPQGDSLLVILLGAGIIAVLLTGGFHPALRGVLTYGVSAALALSLISVPIGIVLGVMVIAALPEGFVFRYRKVCVMVLLGSVLGIAAYFIKDIFEVAKNAFTIVQTFSRDEETFRYGSWHLPNVFVSIEEFKRVTSLNVFKRLGHNPLYFFLGLGGFFYLSWKKPVVLVLIPFLILGFSGFFMGGRFSLYGNIPFGIGVGLGISALLSDRFRSAFLTAGYNVVITLAVVATTYQAADCTPVRPRVSESDAKTLHALRTTIEPDSRIWIWWDLGYAAQYYALRETFADGGWGADTNWKIYPLSFIYATASAQKAHTMIRFITMNGDMSTVGKEVLPSWFDEVKASCHEAITPPQYVFVSWDMLAVSNWISYYGKWDLDEGKSLSDAHCSRGFNRVRFNLKEGKVALGFSSQPKKIDSIDYIDKHLRHRHHEWDNNSYRHVVGTKEKHFYVMNSELYNSLMVQMLIGEPERFKKHFELVVDNFPWNRVYRVK